MARQMQEVRIILDALDECDAGTATDVNLRTELLRWLRRRIKHQGTDHCRIRIIITSRSGLPDITSQLIPVLPHDSIISIENESTKADIRTLIRERLRDNSGFSRWQTPEEKPYLQHIEETLLEKSNLMFRWADLQLNKLERLDSKYTMNRALQSLPEGLNDIYARSLDEVQQDHKGDAILLLQLVLYSDTPPSVRAVLDAMTIDPNGPAGKCVNPDRLMSVDMKPLLPLISNLVRTVQFNYSPALEIAHSSVKDFLLSSSHKEWRHRFQETSARADILRICLGCLGVHGVLSPKVPKHFLRYVKYYMRGHDRLQRGEEEAQEDILKFLILNSFRTQHITVIFLDDRCYQGLPLQVASALGLTRTVKHLLKNGVSANEDGSKASSPYYQELITKYIPQDIGVFPPDNSYLNNALCAACSEGHVEVVRLLLDNGAKIEATLDMHHGVGNPLRLACNGKQSFWLRGESHTNIAKILLERWPNDSAKGRHLGHALAPACINGDPELVRLLIDNGADVNVEDDYYGNALNAASMFGREAHVRMLVAAGANVNSQGGNDGPALKAAYISHHSNIVEFLLQHDADPNVQGDDGGSPFSIASRREDKEDIRLMLKYGANPNLVEERYRGPVEEVMKEMENERRKNLVAKHS